MSEWSIDEMVRGTEQNFKKIAGRGMLFDREAEFAIQAICKSDYSIGIARNAPQSVIDAVVNIAAIGLSLNPAEKLAYLVPRDKKICLDVSYIGLIRAATNDGAISWAHCAVVYSQDTLILNGIDGAPTHKYEPFSKDRGEMVGVYVTVKTSGGDYLTHTMTTDEVFAIRGRSASYKSDPKKTPWFTDEKEMVRKTCVKQASKYWPRPSLGMSTLDKAIEILNNSGEGIEFANQNALLASNTSAHALDAPALVYSDEEFLKKLPAWCELVKSGKTPEKIITTLSSKYALTDGQIKSINELGISNENS